EACRRVPQGYAGRVHRGCRRDHCRDPGRHGDQVSLPFDAIIIGAGQAGPPLAGRLTAAGMSVALIERHLFGGTCVNTGCMPTKALVASAYAARLARRGAEFGIMLDAPIRIDMPRVMARAGTVSANARHGVESWLRGMAGCTGLEGHARFEGRDTGRGRHLVSREDEDVSEAIGEILLAEGIAVRTSADCIRFAPHPSGVAVGVDCTTGEPEIVGSDVLLAVGRRPNTDELGLDTAGI